MQSRVFEYIFLLLTSAELVQGLATFCNGENYFCVTGWTDNSTSCFTITAKRSGWAALGIGSNQMAGADIYIGWKNGSGFTVANLEGRAYIQPGVAATQNVYQSSPLNSSVAPSSGLYFTFCLIDGKNVTANQKYIFADSSEAPVLPNLIDSPFSFHDDFGSFLADFTTSSSDASNSSVINAGGSEGPWLTTKNYTQIVAIHGIFMWLAWILFSIPAVFVARFLKDKMGPKWFPLHWSLMFFGCGLCNLIGFILIILYKRPPHFSASNHEKLGLAIFIFMIGEIFLGWVIDKLYDAQRQGPPVRDQVHWWVGRILLFLAIINVQLGFNQFQESFPGELQIGLVYGNWILIGIYVAVFLYAQFAWYTKSNESHIQIPSEPVIVASS